MTAQKRELSQARTYVKSGKYGEAESLVTTLLKDSANRHNKRVWLALFDVVHQQYNQGNEKLYLKQKQDTAVFFRNARRLVTVGETLDSLAPEYRQRHATLLDVIRGNVFNGGIYFVRKAKWDEAYDFMETYIDCSRQPLFSEFDYSSTDQRLSEAAYWATYAGYKMNDAVKTLRHRKQALNDSLHGDFTLQFMAEARRWLKDEELYVATLQEGFRRYPLFPYFFPRLIDAYTEKGWHERALAVADSALAVNDSNQLFLFAKSSALLRLERYKECIHYCNLLIAHNDSLAEPYFNAGTAYLNMAERLDARKEKTQKKTAFQNARFYMEHYRELAPEAQDKWAPVLYRIYLNLNLGKQFDEIDRLLNK